MTSAQLTARHRLPGGGTFTRRRIALASAMVAAGFAGWLGATVDEQPSAPAPSTQSAAPVAAVPAPVAAVPAAAPASVESLPAGVPAGPREFQSSGQVISVSGDTMTTAAGGETTTFRITPQTTQITLPGVSAPYAATSFAPKQSVVVLGVVHDGVPVATAIADERAVGPNGPPMDYQLPA
ncbi:hypothetical protein [Mycobacterium sp. SMC-4]|uniref:hypothetical protein n=1 Tax=Mycobacterium sp. SMC-4 TaxID=2857059 RepID=UPI003D02724D